MDKNVFYAYVKSHIMDVLPKEFEGGDASVRMVEKAAGSYIGLTVIKKGEKIGPTVNLDRIYDIMEENGLSKDVAVKRVAEIIEDANKKGMYRQERLLYSYLDDYEAATKNFIVVALPMNVNPKMLEEMPVVEKCGIHLAVRMILEQQNEGFTSMLIKNPVLDRWGVSKEELFDDAFKNTVEISPLYFESVASLLARGLPDFTQEKMGPGYDGPPYILSNRTHLNGAAMIFAPGMAERIAADFKVGGSFTILPSSIHEVLILPDSESPVSAEAVAQMEEIVSMVNSGYVDPQERLSDAPLHYDSSKKVIETLEDYLIRHEKEMSGEKEAVETEDMDKSSSKDDSFEEKDMSMSV